MAISKFLKIQLVALALTFLIAKSATADNTWTGLVGNNWDNGSNWSPQFILPASSSTTVLNFGAATNYLSNQNLANPFTLNSMIFTSAATANYTIQGNAINFAQSGSVPPTLTDDSSHDVTFTDPLTLSNTLTTFGIATGTLSMNGAVGGAGGIVKNGAYTLTLGSVNSFGGDVAVNAGALTINNAGALPSGRSVTVAAGAEFRINNSSADNLATPMGTVTLNGGTLRIPAGAADYHINHLNVSNGGTVNFTGSTNFWVHLVGAGAGIDFSGTSTWTGDGTSRLQNDNAGPIDFNISNSSTLTNSIRLAAGTQAQGFHINGGGALVQTATGSSAPLSIDGFSTYRFADPNFVTTGGVTLEAGSVMNYTGAAAATMNRFITLGSGGGQIVPTGGGALTMSGVVSETGGSQSFFAVVGTVIPTGANTFTGKSDVYAGGVYSASRQSPMAASQARWARPPPRLQILSLKMAHYATPEQPPPPTVG